MPQVIGAIIVAALEMIPVIGQVVSVMEFFGSAILYSVVGTTVLLAASIGLQMLLAPSVNPTNGQFTITQAVPFRRRIYGRAKVGGCFIFWDSRKGSLYSVIALASHELDAIEEHWLGDRQVDLNGAGWHGNPLPVPPAGIGGGWVTSVLAPANAWKTQFGTGPRPICEIWYQLGSDSTKTSYPELQSVYPGQWTAQHIGYGIADVLTVQHGVQQSSFTQVFPGGPQPYRAVLRGAKVKDPRNLSAAAVWTDNAVSVLYDYLTHPDGWRISSSFFNSGLGLPITQAAANIADQLVPLANGGTEARYRIWGFYDYNEEPRQVLARMLASCGGWLQPQPDGTIGINVGTWVEPDVTISDEHIITYDAQHYLGVFDVVNEVRATFFYQPADYQQAESTPWQNTDDINKRGYVKSITLDTRHCPTFTQTRRVQKIGFYEATPEWTFTLVTNAYGLAARNKRFVNLKLDELGLNLTCRVTSFVHDLRSGRCSIGLSSFPSSAYDWDPALEEGPAPPVPLDTSTANTIETPANFTATVETSVISGGVAGAYIVFSADAPSDRYDLSVRFEYQIEGSPSTQWTTLNATDGNYSAATQLLPSGTYDARASFRTSNGASSDYATITGIVVSPDTAAPPSPFDLFVSQPSPATSVTFQFTAPNSPNFYAGAIWRSVDTNFSNAVNVSGAIYGSPNQVLYYTDTPAAGTWHYWATAQNSATPPNYSVPDGPVSVTVV